MGIYLNPTNDKFHRSLNSEIYVDKSELIAYTNNVLGTNQQYVCVSRPRRFGKSMALDMLAAYYGRNKDSRMEFDGLRIAKDPGYARYMNQYNVISINMQEFLSNSQHVEDMLGMLRKRLLYDIRAQYPDVSLFDENNLTFTMQDIYNQEQVPFVILIDEWDCIFREKKCTENEQKQYLDFLRDWLKDKAYTALVYMTGILPIKKYGSHSALNMFQEFSMTNPRELEAYVGFTEEEVLALCQKYNRSFDDMKAVIDAEKSHGGLRAETDFEAFILNEMCQFTGAFCNSLHCDELGHLCRVPYWLKPVDDSCDPLASGHLRPSAPAAPLQISPPDSSELPNGYLCGATGCGLCALYRFREIGITHLKLVGRGNYTDYMEQDIRMLRRALMLLEHSTSEKDFQQNMREQLFPQGCSSHCYYL